MVFEHIEKLQRDYTDQYVVVDEQRPELARFKGQTGRVRTVNMNGQALVEFDKHLNIGWYDIDIDYLKVVDEPVKQPEKPAKPAKKPAPKAAPAAAGGEKKLSPLELARMQDGGGKKTAKEPEAKPAGGAMSTADILAAARGGKAAADKESKAESAPAKPAGGKMSTADVLAAARGGAAVAKEEDKAESTPAKPAAEMTLAEKLAAARGDVPGGSGGAATAAEQEPKTEAPAAAPVKPAAEMTLAEKLAAARGVTPSVDTAAAAPADSEESPSEQAEETAADSSEDSSPAGAAEAVDKDSMSIDDMIAWCRQHDAQ